LLAYSLLISSLTLTGTSPIKTTHNAEEDNALKRAIGQKTFDLDIGAEELNEIIDESFTNIHSARNNNKFARFLRMVSPATFHSLFYHALIYSFVNIDKFESSIGTIL